jgi:hypothetical protein
MKPFAFSIILLLATVSNAGNIRRSASRNHGEPANLRRIKDEEDVYNRYFNKLNHPPPQSKIESFSKDKDIQWNIVATKGPPHIKKVPVKPAASLTTESNDDKWHEISESNPFDDHELEKPPSPSIVDDEDVDFQPASQLHNALFNTEDNLLKPKKILVPTQLPPKNLKFVNELSSVVKKATEKYGAKPFALSLLEIEPVESKLSTNVSKTLSPFNFFLKEQRLKINESRMRCNAAKEISLNATENWRKSRAVVSGHLASIEQNFEDGANNGIDHVDINGMLQSSSDSLNTRVITSELRRKMDEAIEKEKNACSEKNRLNLEFNNNIDESISKNVKEMKHINKIIDKTTKEYHDLMDVARELTADVERLQKEGNDIKLTDKLIASEKAIHALKTGKEYINGLKKRLNEFKLMINHLLDIAGRKRVIEGEKEIEESKDVTYTEHWETNKLELLKESLTSTVSEADSKVEEVEKIANSTKSISDIRN